MNSPDFLKNLVLDAWFKVFIVVGSVLFIVSLFIDLKGITNIQAQMLAGFLFFLGIGEWINQDKDTEIIPPNIYLGGHALMVERHLRRPKRLGLVFDIVAFILLISFLISIFVILFIHPVSILKITPTPK